MRRGVWRARTVGRVPGVGRTRRMGVQVLTATMARDDDFASVYAANRDRAVRLAWLLTSDADQAEDVVADAFAKVWRRWKRGGIDDPAAYIRRAVVNEANSKLRRRYRERAEDRRRTGDDRGIRLVEDQAADRDAVWQALQHLPERQRAAVVLRYYEDLSEAATAEVLGIAVGTVKSLTSRGLERLQRELVRAGIDVKGGAL